MDSRHVTVITFWAIVGVVILCSAGIWGITTIVSTRIDYFGEIAPVSCQCSCVKENKSEHLDHTPLDWNN